MKRAIKVIVAIVFLNTWFISNLFSQEGLKGTQEERLRYLSYNFPSDSLKGFDQASANNAALAGGFFGIEYKVYMYRAKRNFINSKYGYSPAPTMDNAKGITPVINTAPCVNEDFEASPVGLVGATLTGWTISEGSNSNSCTMGGCCPTAGGADAWIRTTPYASGTTIGTIPNSPFGGTKILQMNDQFTNMGETVRIQQTFPVTATSALFKLAYMAQMDGTGHVCCDQPFLKITMLNCSNVPLACPSLSLNAPGASCATTMPAGWSTNTSGYSYTTAWQIYSLDLTPYLGSCVTIQVTVGDCDGWAHHGMAFIDCDCDPMNVTVNNLQFPIGTSAANAAACGVTSATVTAPTGLGPYSWTGPAGSGVTNNPNQTFTTSVSGNYTLTMNPPGSCAPITRTVTLTFAPNPLATFTSANSCTTYSFTNTGTAAPAVQTYSFVGPGAPASFTTTSPTSVVNFAPSTTFTVYHTVTNTSSCTATNSMVINVPNGPNPAFTTATYTQCLTGNAFTFNAASNPGTHSYSFSPSVGAPAVGNTNPYGPVSFTAPGTYTVTHVLTNAGCTSSTSSVVVINPQPTVAVSNNGPMCVGGNVALTTTATAGATFNWSGPGGFTSAIANPTLTGVTLASAGVYNVTVTLNGCTGTGSTNVVVSTATVAPTNTGPYCPGQTIQLNTAAATSYTWSGPNAFASNLQNPTIAGATPAIAGTYSLSITNGGCVASGTTAVVVNAAITPTASNTGPYCAGSTIQLNTSAANTYTWSGPGGFTSNAQNPTIATSSVANSGTYTVNVTTAAGCTGSVTTAVVVNPIPVPVIGSNSPICTGTTLSLTATGGTSYSWSGPAGFTSALQNPTVAGASTVNAGVYNVTVTALGCTNTGSVNVTILTATTSASNTGPYCVGSTISLSTPAVGTYTWTGPSGFTSNVQNPTIANSTTLMGGTYNVTVSVGTCTASATTNVVVNALPTPVAGNTGAYCPGNTIQLNVGAFNTYTWTGPSSFSSNLQNPTQANAQTTNSGTYTVSVTDANGCVNTTTTNVVVNPTPVVVIGSNSPVCLNTAINLTSGGGTSYAWSGPNAFSSALQNPTIASAVAANSGVYTVTVTSLGCTNTGTVNVNVLTPTTTAANTGPYCAGQTISLSTPAANTYTWTGPGGFTSNVQNPTIASSTAGMSGTYNVTVAVGSCTAAASTNVVVNALPNPTAGSNSPICEGQTLNLTGSAASTYTWSGPNTFASNIQNPSITSASLAAGGTYTFMVTDANNCTNSVTAVVVVNSNPVIAVNNPTVCVGTTINLTSNGGTGYAWSGPGGFSSAVQNPSIANATSGMTGAYTVTVISAQGCTNTAVANVNVFPVPSPTITSNSPVCVGGVLNLSGSGGAVYAWAGPNGFVSVGQNASIPNVSLLADGVYTLLATAGSCSASTTASITINPLPNPTINSNSPICIGNDINLTGNGGTGYAWSGPGGFTSTAQNPTITAAGLSNSGLYTLVVTDANNCVNTTSATVIVNPQPIVAAAGSTVCENANATLSANGGVTYSWSGPGGFTSNSQNPQITVVPLTASGQYTVLITDANTCTNTAVADMVINPAPVPNMTANSPCEHTSLNLTASGGVTYSWSSTTGFTSSSQNPSIASAVASNSGTYSVTVTDANGCSATTSTNVVVNPLPLPAITGGPNTGCAPLCVQFNVASIPSASTAAWNLGNGSVASGLTANSCYNTAGIYTISAGVTDQNGCSGVATYTVEVYPQPIADFNHAPIKPIINIDGEVTFTDASHGANIVSWNWYFMNTAQYTSNVQNPTFMYTEAGTYPVALVVKSDKGCSDTIVRPLVVGEDFGIYVPNAFTPNDDGINDKFQPKGFGIVKYNIKIFDRWGEIIFQTSTFEEGWDGKYQGRGGPIVEEGVYTWLIEVTNVFGKAHELKGHVTLIK